MKLHSRLLRIVVCLAGVFALTGCVSEPDDAPTLGDPTFGLGGGPATTQDGPATTQDNIQTPRDGIVSSPVGATCVAPTLRCAQQTDLAQCVHHLAGAVTVADYTSGTRAYFYGTEGLATMLVSSDEQECYQVEEVSEAGLLTITDRVSGRVYRVVADATGAQLTCPDGTTATVDLTELKAALPIRPATTLCETPTSNDECNTDSDCGDPRLGCCDGGNRRICAADCQLARGHQRCDTGASCDGDDFCCAASHVRICDFATCKDEICCFVPRAMVCAPQSECQQ